jgi:hypothetical protein
MAHVHAPGLVLRFDPETLAEQGAAYAGAEDTELSAQQYYVCLEANAKDALWIPLFAGPGPGRKGIAANAKTGNAHWTRNSSFYHNGHLCRIGHKAAAKAAEAARDHSTAKAPNRLALEHLPPRAEFPEDAAFRPMKGNVAIR